MKRKFYNVLMNWKENYISIPLMIIGARQIGKTYIINKFCQNEFEDYININLMKDINIRNIFNENINFEEKIRKIELELNHKINPETTVLFIDEIQESELAISELKQFAESKIPYKVICAGSLLGVKINRFHSSFPVGKVRIEIMHSMDFEEFLLALDKKMWIDEIKRCYENLEEISIHEQLLNLYRTYLCIGGMPESIKSYRDNEEDIFKYDKKIIENIQFSYLADMKKYTQNATEAIRNEKVYLSVPKVLSKENKKFQYTEIEKDAKKREYEMSIQWLISSQMLYPCTLVNKTEVPLKVYEQPDSFKLYLNDIGILTSLLEIDFSNILLDKEFMFKGAIAENYVAQVFQTNHIPLHYWKSKNSAEIDFLISNSDGVIPVEVKAKDNTKSKSLKIYMEKYNPEYAIRISSKNFGFTNNIKSIPLYAAFCIK